MANLSNINGKFVVEQTTGYVGVGTTDPNYPIEVLNASAEIALNASGGSIYRVQSDSASNFIIRKAGVGDRLIISSAGNATFAGTVTAGGADDATALFLKRSGGANVMAINTSANGSWTMFDYAAGTYTSGITQKSGNVGIGTTLPDFALDIEAVSSGVQLQIGRTVTSAGSTWMGSDSNGFHLGVGAYGAGNSVSDPNGFSVDTSGNVGIGTTSPTYPLTLSGGAANTNPGTVEAPYIGEELAFKIENPGWSSTNGLIRMIQPAGAYVNNASMTFSTLQGSLTEKMRIENNGNVGIGTTSPDSLLTVSGSSLQNSNNAGIELSNSHNAQTVLLIENTTSRKYEVAVGGSANSIGNGSFYIYDGTAGAARLVIDSSGNVGIGTNSPGRKLTVTGDASGDANNLLLSNENDTNGDSASIGFSMLSNNTYVKSGIFFERTTTQGRGSLHLAVNNEVNGNNVTKSDAKLTINNVGNVGIGTTSPGVKLEVNGSTRIGGNNYGHQTVFASKAAAGNNVGVDVMFVGHTHSLDVNVMVVLDGAQAAVGRGYALSAYGYATATLTQTQVSGNMVGVSITYVNSGGLENYVLRVTPTYTGSTNPTIYLTVNGQSNSIVRIAT